MLRIPGLDHKQTSAADSSSKFMKVSFFFLKNLESRDMDGRFEFHGCKICRDVFGFGAKNVFFWIKNLIRCYFLLFRVG